MTLAADELSRMLGHINARIQPDEMWMLYTTARKLAPTRFHFRIVEIGSCHGASAACLGLGAPLAHMTLIDKMVYRKSWGQPSVEAITDNLHKVGLRNFEIIEADSMTLEGDYPADLVYIDGCHDYANIWNDLTRFGAVSPVVICHDYRSPRDLAVEEAVNKFIKEYHYRIRKRVRLMVELVKG